LVGLSDTTGCSNTYAAYSNYFSALVYVDAMSSLHFKTFSGVDGINADVFAWELAYLTRINSLITPISTASSTDCIVP
jgi:hypothetical protein